MSTPDPYDPYDPYALAWADWTPPHQHTEDPAEGVDGLCKGDECRDRRWHVSTRRTAHRIKLERLTKGALVATYRSLGGLGGIYPPEKWRKDELASSIAEMEERRDPRKAGLL